MVNHIVRILLRLTCIASLVFVTTGCDNKRSFTLEKEEILSIHANQPGILYLTQGASGPYAEVASAVGNRDSSGSFHISTATGIQPPVAWPSTPGFHYEVHGYMNASEEAFYVVRKIPNNKAEQVAGENH